MTPVRNIFELNAIVTKGIGKLPGESIEVAALRVLAPGAASSLPKRRAATILLRRDLAVWDRMRRAAEVFEGKETKR
jgi:hypothetical protein